MYNKANDTHMCKCPICNGVFNELTSYLVFGMDARYFIHSQLTMYRNIIYVNTHCNKFYEELAKIDKRQFNKITTIPNYQLLLWYYITMLHQTKQPRTNAIIDDLIKVVYDSTKLDTIVVDANGIPVQATHKHHHSDSSDESSDESSDDDQVPTLTEAQKKLIAVIRVMDKLEPESKLIICDYSTSKTYRVTTEDPMEGETVEDMPYELKRYLLDKYVLKWDVQRSSYNISLKNITYDDHQPDKFNIPNKVFGHMLLSTSTRKITKTYYHMPKSHRGILGMLPTIREIFKSRSRTITARFMNNCQVLEQMLMNELNGTSQKQLEMGTDIETLMIKMIDAQQFEPELFTQLMRKYIITTNDDKIYDRTMKHIRGIIYGDIEETDHLDALLLSTTNENGDDETKYGKITYKQIFGDIPIEFNMSSTNSSFVNFQKCNLCGGFVVVRDGIKKCLKCSTEYCIECGEVKEGEHACDPHTLATLKLISDECKKCPCCGVPIYKSHGCNHMFCTNCHNSFDWSTGDILDEKYQTNPLYFEWKRNRETFHGIYSSDMESYKKLLIEAENDFANQLVAVVEKDEVGYRLLHMINKYKCLMGYTKHAYTRGISYAEYKEKREMINLIFGICLESESRIIRAADKCKSFYEDLLEEVYDKLDDDDTEEDLLNKLSYTNDQIRDAVVVIFSCLPEHITVSELLMKV